MLVDSLLIGQSLSKNMLRENRVCYKFTCNTKIKNPPFRARQGGNHVMRAKANWQKSMVHEHVLGFGKGIHPEMVRIPQSAVNPLGV
jgi:hypothetical protein